MDKIRFPYRVKVNGAYYDPGEVIEVKDAAEFTRQGAEVVSRGADKPRKEPQTESVFAEEEPPKRPGRPKKNQ